MPRKTSRAASRDIRTPGASMRPRPDAAENPPRLTGEATDDVVASMRPRPDAAENRAQAGALA